MQRRLSIKFMFAPSGSCTVNIGSRSFSAYQYFSEYKGILWLLVSRPTICMQDSFPVRRLSLFHCFLSAWGGKEWRPKYEMCQNPLFLWTHSKKSPFLTEMLFTSWLLLMDASLYGKKIVFFGTLIFGSVFISLSILFWQAQSWQTVSSNTAVVVF